MIISFDMDGVLVGTREAVREAYAAAGVSMPDDAWGKPWQDWLPLQHDNPREVHDVKNALYPGILKKRGVEPLAGFQVASELADEGYGIAVVTHASQRAANIVAGELGVDWPFFAVSDKAASLSVLNPVCHVDDFPVEKCPVTFVPYVEDVVGLYDRIREVINGRGSPRGR